jgi:molybdate transport system substrate-binding protein
MLVCINIHPNKSQNSSNNMRKCITFILFLLSCGPLSYADEVRVGVASNFLGTLRSLAPMFEQQTGHRMLISSASSGMLYAQIKQGAPFDIYMAANTSYPQRLEEEGMALADSRRTYAVGQLVLANQSDTKLQGGLREILLQHGGRIAIANPRSAPYGMAAIAVIDSLEIRDAVHTRIVTGENIAQTFQFVVTGNAEYGFVALSQVIGYKRGKIHYHRIPEAMHGSLEQQLVLLNRGKDNPAAQAFIDFILGDDVQNGLQARGYKPRGARRDY